MNSAAGNTDDKVKNTSIPSSTSVSIGKEQEAVKIERGVDIEEIPKEVEVPPEVERAGLQVQRDVVELPPDVKKLGVTPSGPSAPPSYVTSFSKIVLPISDQQVTTGLHASVVESLAWLAAWCMKQLKKAHVALKVVHGKIVRV